MMPAGTTCRRERKSEASLPPNAGGLVTQVTGSRGYEGCLTSIPFPMTKLRLSLGACCRRRAGPGRRARPADRAVGGPALSGPREAVAARLAHGPVADGLVDGVRSGVGEIGVKDTSGLAPPQALFAHR